MSTKYDLKIIQLNKIYLMTDKTFNNTALQKSAKKARSILFDDEIYKVIVIDKLEDRQRDYRANQFRNRRRQLTTIGEEREREVKELLIEEHGKDYLL